MRFLALATLLVLALATPTALAQQQGALTFFIQPPDHALHAGDHPTLVGTATLTVDVTAYTGVAGIPVAYSVSKLPASLHAVVSPSNDLFPLPNSPTLGLSYSVSRQVTVSLVVDEDLPAGFHADTIEVTAFTSPTFAGKSIMGRAMVPLMLAGASNPCPAGTVSTQSMDATPLASGPGTATMVLGVALLGGLVAIGLLGRRRALPLAALGALLLAGVAAPLASAQQQGSMVLMVTPTSNTLAPGSAAILPGAAHLTVDDTAMLGVIGIPVMYAVTKAPAWAAVAVLPGTDIFPAPPSPTPSPVYTMARNFQVAVLVGDLNFTGTRIDTIEITATTTATTVGHSILSKVSFPISVTSPACKPEAKAAAAVTPPAVEKASAPPAKETPLTVQTQSAIIPTGGYALLAGFAVAGAGVGLLLRRRTR
jgi:hypothetical protein